MKKLFKKTMSILLCVVMLVGSAPMSGFADINLPDGLFSNAFERMVRWFDGINLSSSASAAGLASTGQCGDNVYWTFDSDTGTLTISGEGAMYDYSNTGSPFYNNKTIKTAVIENGVTSIGDYSFYNCASLTYIDIPESIKNIGISAFYYCSGIKKVNISNIAAWCGISFHDTYSNPLYYAKKLYLNNALITNLVLPGNLTSISGGAFCCCAELTSVTIPGSVDNIGEYAFYGCTGLTSITIPEGTTSIGENAFADCTGLVSVAISETVTSIGEYAFYGCPDLKSITVDENNNSYDGRSNCNAIIDTRTNWLLVGCCNTIIPNGVTAIYHYAFANCNDITSIVIPDSVMFIGSYTFCCCKNLTSIEIPDSVRIICEGAFYNCPKLLSIIVDEDNKVYDSRNDCNALIETETNSLITGSANTIIPEGVTSICEYAFYNCEGLTSITVPNGVTDIGNYAFCKCKNLTNVTISDSVTSIGDAAFLWTNLTSITLGNGLKSIGICAFADCKELKNIIIPNGVTNIGGGAFEGCSGLTSITIPDGVTSIGESTFYYCFELTSVTLPNSITSIGKDAFKGCKGLTSVTIPDSVTSIGQSAFWMVNNIVYSGNASGSPWGAERVNYYADGFLLYKDSTKQELCFCNPIATGNIVIPNGVNVIKESAFKNCTNLTSVTMPNSITNIGYNAFYGVNNIIYSQQWYENTMNSTGSPWGAKAVDAYVENGLYYYDSSKELLLGCSPDVTGTVTIPNTVEEVGDNCFMGCDSITDLTFQSTEIVFSDMMLCGCKNLETITSSNTDDDGITYTMMNNEISLNSDNIESDEGSRLNKCKGILFCNRNVSMNYTVGSDVLYICENAFANCRFVTVNLDNAKLTKIGKNAFLNSKDYIEKKFPIWSNGVFTLGNYIIATDDTFNSSTYTTNDNIVLIADYAFKDCTSLKSFIGKAALKYIGAHAFGDSGVTWKNVFFDKESKIESIGENIFASDDETEIEETTTVSCGTTLVSVSKDVETFTIDPGTTCIAAGAFKDCLKLKSIEIPSTVKVIDDNTFNGCINLQSVTINEGVTEIGKYAFKDCVSLTTVNIPSTVTKIGDLAFNGCVGLKSFTVAEGNKKFSTENGILYQGSSNNNKYFLVQCPAKCTASESLEIANSGYICDLAFENCKSFETIIITAKGVSYGNRNPFANCSANYGDKNYLIKDKVLISVSDCKDFDSSILKNVTEIGNRAFYQRTELKKITIPSNVTRIDDYAFYGCTGLTEIIIPNSVKLIGESAFENCTNLKRVTFMPNKDTDCSDCNETLTSIGEYAFCNCLCNADGGCCNKDILKAEGLKIGDYSFHNHTEEYNTWVVTLSPTYDSVGHKVKHCSECGRTVEKNIPKLEHKTLADLFKLIFKTIFDYFKARFIIK